MEEIAHYTDFASLIANDTIDKQKVAKHFSRAAESYDAAAVVQRDMAQRLLSLLPENFDALHILEIGCGTGFLPNCWLNVLQQPILQSTTYALLCATLLRKP